MRWTDAEMMRKMPGSGTSSNSSAESQQSSEDDSIEQLVIVRENCIPVVKGLVALLLSMDFTCHVDLFLVACKVRICAKMWKVYSLGTVIIKKSLQSFLWNPTNYCQ